ncbi:hypothetical protein LguiB_020268 [Lonicera macranthoides]
MSRMMRSDRKPPLARSPIRLRSRGTLQPNSNFIQTPPGNQMKTKLTKTTWDIENSELRPEYHTISCEFRALAKMLNNQFGDDGNVGFLNANAKAKANANANNKSPLFERGRFYEEYSARRNERLRRKKGGEIIGDEKKTPYGLGVRVESAKRKESKKLESMRKTMPLSTPMTERREAPRYLLRSSNKENKKPPLAATFEKSVGVGERKIGARRTRKI